LKNDICTNLHKKSWFKYCTYKHSQQTPIAVYESPVTLRSKARMASYACLYCSDHLCIQQQIYRWPCICDLVYKAASLNHVIHYMSIAM